MFPITIDKLSLRHRGGTKEYHLVQVLNANGKGLLIKRWGKTGQWGQLGIERHTGAANLNAAYEKMRRTKEGRDYTMEVAHQSHEATNMPELQKMLGAQYMTEIRGADHEHLLGAEDDVENFFADMEDGDPLPTKADMVEVAKEREAKKRAEREAAKVAKAKEEADLKANPNWGIF